MEDSSKSTFYAQYPDELLSAGVSSGITVSNIWNRTHLPGREQAGVHVNNATLEKTGPKTVPWRQIVLGTGIPRVRQPISQGIYGP